MKFLKAIIIIIFTVVFCYFVILQISPITVRVIEQYPNIVTTITQKVLLPFYDCVNILGDGVIVEICR